MVAVVDDGVETLEVGAVGIDVRVREIGLDDVVDGPALGLLGDVEQHQVVALAKRGQELARDVAGGAGQQHPWFAHGQVPLPQPASVARRGAAAPEVTRS